MIKLLDVNISFGARPILADVNWMLGDQDRVGLVGENGSGKSTLLKVMTGAVGPDRGKIETTRNLKIGYLPQEGLSHQGKTLDQEMKSALTHILSLEEEHKKIEQELESTSLPPEKQQELVERMADLMDKFQLSGGYELKAEIGRVLSGLGFKEHERERTVESFSGGWQMRIALAKLLLSKPRVLLLDEPTNHLDLEARNWLEQYLREYPYAYLIVSHDRYFLDVTIDRIVEMENGAVIDYRGNYSYYLGERERRIGAAESAYEKQQLEVQRIHSFINKYRADKKRASQVQSRMKKLDKIKPLCLPSKSKPVYFHFPPAPRGPQVMIRIERGTKSYGDNLVLDEVELALVRGEKVALVGENGAGKSTLLEILSQRKKLDQGTLEYGDGTQIAFFGQDVDDELDPRDTVLDAIGKGAPFDMHSRLRSLLGMFLFTGDDVDKKVSVLSGGEKSRLALARLLLRPANLLILDEPTNHLDLRAKEVLMDAFKNYTGTLLYVAHDRYFLEGLPERVLEVRGHKVRSYPGDYSDYLYARQREENDMADEPESPKAAVAKNDKNGPEDKAKAKAERIKKREEEKARHRAEQKKKKRNIELEREISESEERIKKIVEATSDPKVASDYVRLMGLTKEKEELLEKLDDLYLEWEGLV